MYENLEVEEGMMVHEKDEQFLNQLASSLVVVTDNYVTLYMIMNETVRYNYEN